MKKILLLAVSALLIGNNCFADAYYSKPPVKNINSGELTQTVYPDEVYELLKAIVASNNDIKLYVDLAKLYESKGYQQEAEETYIYIFENVNGNKEVLKDLETIFIVKLNNNPESDYLYMKMGTIYKLQGRYREALAQYQKAISLNPPSMTQRVALASLYVEQKEYVKAIQIYDAVLAAHPHNIKVRTQKADALVLMGLKEKAIGEYKTVLRMQPTNFAARMGLYEILKKSVTRDEVIRALYSEYKNSPVNAIAYYKLAGDLKFAKKYNDSKYFYKLAINIDPAFSEAYIDLADIYIETGNNDAAKSLLVKAMKSMPTDLEIENKYKYTCFVEKQEQKASADLLVKKGSYDEAIALYSQIEPATVESLLGIATCYQYQSKYNDALDYLNRALAVNPKNPSIYYNFGFLYLNKEDFTSAKFYLNKALELQPENIQSKKLLTFIMEQEANKLASQVLNEYDKKNYDKALTLVDSLIKLYPKSADANYYKGLILAAQGENIEAINEFQNTIKLNSKYSMAYYSLAVAYDSVKKSKEALANYKKFLSLNKEDNKYTQFAKKRVGVLNPVKPETSKK